MTFAFHVAGPPGHFKINATRAIADLHAKIAVGPGCAASIATPP
jgi:hypothetical protein